MKIIFEGDSLDSILGQMQEFEEACSQVPVLPTDQDEPAATISGDELVPTTQATPAPVPAQPAPIAVLTGNQAEFDSRNIPWDERIHAATQTKNKDGSWRNKRGVSKEEIARIESEIKSAPAPVPTTETAPAPVPTTETAPAPVPTTEPDLSIPPLLNRLQPQQQTPAPVPAIVTYETVCQLMADKIAAGKISEEALMPNSQFWIDRGLTNINDLNGNQAALDEVYATLSAVV